MTRVIHIDELSRPADKSPLFSCQYLSPILLVTILYPSIHNTDTHYSLSKPPLFPIGARHIAIFKLSHQLPSQKIKRFFLSHLTLLFSIQSTFRERRFMIHLKYFLQIYPPKNWWIQKSSTFAPAAQSHSGFHRTYSSFCRWLTLKYWRMKRK